MAFPGASFFFFFKRAWELNFNHAGVAFVDNCITGFLKLEDLRNTIDPERSASMTHTGWVGGVGGMLSVCDRAARTSHPPSAHFPPLFDLDKLSNVNTDGAPAVTTFPLCLAGI